MSAGHWNAREFDLLETLTCRVRVLSRDQIHTGWRQTRSSPEELERELRRLVDARLMATQVWRVQRPSIGKNPLFAWQSGAAAPDLKSLAAQVRNRWMNKCESLRVYVATSLTARLMGSSAGGFPAANHRNHDLLLSAVYVNYRRNEPDKARRWIGEDALPMAETGIKNPDAFLIDDNSQRCHVVESAGRYSRQQLRQFHQYCCDEQLSYELW